MIKLLIGFYFLVQSILVSQDMTNSHIKQLIETRQLNKAREELAIAMQGNENDPTLDLYQTELWVAEGDTYYNARQYKKALEIYEKAIVRYPANPMVKMKYQEMLNKIKAVEKPDKDNNPIVPFPIQPMGLQGGNGNEHNFLPSDNLHSSLSKTDFLLSLLCIENFILIVLVGIKIRKK